MSEIGASPFTISCDECAARRTTACDDCVVSFVLRNDSEAGEHEFDGHDVRVVHLLNKAGLVPALRYSEAG